MLRHLSRGFQKLANFPKYSPPVSRNIHTMKYILVTGGVISGVGKGVIASSVGTILKACGIRVTSIKIDPYINIDAGTFSPYEHGEVYVLDDGGEVDLDLGNYERFLDVTLHRDNNITTGKIYQQVITKERRGDYLGKTVQVVPHITDAIQEWVETVAKVPVDGDAQMPEVCIVELGGTIGDIEGMPFVEAFRQFQFRVKRENFCCMHVSLVPQPKTTGEQKTKPTQNSVRELRGLGLSPDLIVCRSNSKLAEGVKDKISNFCHVSPEQVICVHDVSSIYRVPLLLEDQRLVEYFAQRLQLPLALNKPRRFLMKWRDLADRYDRMLKEVTIALVGKYTRLEDAYTSVVKALQHAAMACDHKLNLKCIEAEDLEQATRDSDPVRYHEAWQQLCSSNGILVPGGFGVRGMEGKILAAEWARNTNKPYLAIDSLPCQHLKPTDLRMRISYVPRNDLSLLVEQQLIFILTGVCLGLQCAVIEFSRNVLKMEGAHSTEADPKTKYPVVIEMPEHHPGDLGGTMRLGKRRTNFKTKNSILRKLYGDVDSVEERHRHRYEVNPEYVPQMENQGLVFVGQDVDGERMEIMELKGHPYYVAVQYHPEYISRPLKASEPYLGLLLASCGKLSSYLSKGCRHSPRVGYSQSPASSSEEDDDGISRELSSLRLKPESLQMASTPPSVTAKPVKVVPTKAPEPARKTDAASKS